MIELMETRSLKYVAESCDGVSIQLFDPLVRASFNKKNVPKSKSRSFAAIAQTGSGKGYATLTGFL
jgi:hypothetical protein